MAQGSTAPPVAGRPPPRRPLAPLVAIAALCTMAVYLFATAPAPLPAQAQRAPAGATISVEQLFDILNNENRVARASWTADIVGAGKPVGLRFAEDWRESAVEAGPLPALFLRETAGYLEKHADGLSLFLGSAYPINAANRFAGSQVAHADALKATGQPQYFYEPSVGRQTAMFADVAVADACVTCHNEHPQSPKRDWQRGDMMGATTWMYPDKQVSVETALRLVGVLRAGFRATYQRYLDKTATFAEPPVIGTQWPKDGRFLPTVDVFMAEHARRAAPTLEALIHAAPPAEAP
ncbi:MAG: DUF3365 domain-containing protein [Kofleriaceae bacterium]